MAAALFSMRQLRAPKMTLRQLQQATGINKGSLSQIERGKRVATPDELARIADALAVDRLEIRVVPFLEADL